MKKRREFSNFGFSTILLTFSMICIVTFSALAFVTANSDYKLSKRVADNNSSYYRACEKVWDEISQIDAILASAYDGSPDKAAYYEAIKTALSDNDTAIGGMETFVMNVYRTIDRERVQFDFLYHYDKPCFFDDEIRALGGRIYKLTVRQDNNIPRYLRALRTLFAAHPEWRIIHGHYSGFGMFYNPVAKRAGIPVRCGHSHNTAYEPNLVGQLDRVMSTFTVKFICDRGVSHEIVRHRMASYCQESTRYCNYSKDGFGNEITVIEPCFWDKNSLAGKVKMDCWRIATKIRKEWKARIKSGQCIS